VLAGEISLLQRPFQSSKEFYGYVASMNTPRGQSTEYDKAVLSDCLLSLNSIAYDPRARVRAKALSRSCHSLATAIIEKSPVNTFAWLVRAVAAASVGDTKAMEESILASRSFGPREPWIAYLRIRLTESNLEKVGPQTKLAQKLDFETLLMSPTGIVNVAKIYIDDPSARSKISEAVSKTPDRIQAFFLFTINEVKDEKGF
jgi:hypothetical protein